MRYSAIREENVRVFENTKRLCTTDPGLKEGIASSNIGQRLIRETDPVNEKMIKAGKKRFPDKAKIVVSTKRTYEAASAYAGEKVAVLNFASASNPGGGVLTGAGAQEECLCRCSTLYFNLIQSDMWQGFYEPHRAAGNPLHNDDIIYTPGVLVIKSDTAKPELLAAPDRYSVNVVTCAAPNLRKNPSNRYNPGDGDSVTISDRELQALHEKRLRRILDVAVEEGNEVIILGAFGCGAFRNDPHVVASAAKAVLPDYMNAFRTIEFAVYCRDDDRRNYEVFRTAFSR